MDSQIVWCLHSDSVVHYRKLSHIPIFGLIKYKRHIMRRTVIIGLIVLFFMIITFSCTPGSGRYTYRKPAGFFTGIWHGWIAPVTLIIGIFNHDIRIYETSNTGWWYDFGFYMAVIAGFGSLSLTRKRWKIQN